MNTQELEHIFQEVNQLVQETGKLIQQYAGQIRDLTVKEKAKNSLVTEADVAAEHKLIEGLQKIVPEAGYIAEEQTTEQHDQELMWLVDPIDGTTNFVHQIPVYCISIALQQNNETVFGIVYEVNSGECFYTWQGTDAYRDGAKISVTETANLSEALIGTGFPTTDFSRMHAYIDTMMHLIHHTQGLRRYGTAALDLCYVACGRFDAYFEYSLSPWDVAAGSFIVQQAGGKVTDFSGGENYLNGREIIATNGELYDEVQKIVQKNLVQS